MKIIDREVVSCFVSNLLNRLLQNKSKRADRDCVYDINILDVPYISKAVGVQNDGCCLQYDSSIENC